MKLKSYTIIIIILSLSFKIIIAENNWNTKIPNGEYVNTLNKTSCQICHEFATPTLTTSDLNNFGNDFDQNGQTWCIELAILDSDNDGFTNEQELQCQNNYDWVFGICGDEFYKASNPGDGLVTPGISTETNIFQEKNEFIKATPNPFNPSTTISFYFKNKDLFDKTSISIFSINGKLIKKFDLTFKQNVNKKITWNGTDKNGHKVSSGIYIAVIKNTYTQLTCKLILCK